MPLKQDSVGPHSTNRPQQDSAVMENHVAPHKPASDLPSCGELERSVGQSLQRAYRQHLGHLPTRVSCHLFADKLSIWIENSLTPVENILLSSSEFATEPGNSSASFDSQSAQPLAQLGPLEAENQSAKKCPGATSSATYFQQVRVAIDQAMQQRLRKVIEECLGVEVIALISGTCYEQNCTSLTALLSSTPTVRNPDKIPKTAASRQAARKSPVKAGA